MARLYHVDRNLSIYKYRFYKSSPKRTWRAPPLSSPLKHRPALFGEGAAGFEVVFGHCGAGLVHRLHFEHRRERLGLRGEQVALHVAVGDSWPVGDAPR